VFVCARDRLHTVYAQDDRSRAIYKYALDHVPKHLAGDLYQDFVNFEKQV
jgi:hypothetical protein